MFKQCQYSYRHIVLSLTYIYICIHFENSHMYTNIPFNLIQTGSPICLIIVCLLVCRRKLWHFKQMYMDTERRGILNLCLGHWYHLQSCYPLSYRSTSDSLWLSWTKQPQGGSHCKLRCERQGSSALNRVSFKWLKMKTALYKFGFNYQSMKI